jgi:signal transduction histidine kinase
MVRQGAEYLADLLEARREQLVDAGCAELTALGNTLVRKLTTLDQVRRHYDEILRDVSASLRDGTMRLDESYTLAREIGTARASAGVHPGESLQAGLVLYEITLAAAADLVAEHDLELSAFGLAALALQSSITQRVQEAFAVYTSFLLDKVHLAQTEERRRIARDLHDRIGHSLSVAHHQLELGELYSVEDAEKSALKLFTAQRAVTDAMASLREVAGGLHSSAPQQSMRKALVEAAQEIAAVGVDLTVQVNGDEGWAERPVLDQCTLMFREAVRNAIEHGRPRSVGVNVDITPGEIRALVLDDGTGFDTDAPAHGLGLAAMRERAEALGGNANVRSRPGVGTRVSFVIPLGGSE